MNAKRIYTVEQLDANMVCYWKARSSKYWTLYIPGGGIAELVNHHVVVHDNGTITVTPTIQRTCRVGGERGKYVQVCGTITQGKWEDR